MCSSDLCLFPSFSVSLSLALSLSLSLSLCLSLFLFPCLSLSFEIDSQEVSHGFIGSKEVGGLDSGTRGNEVRSRERPRDGCHMPNRVRTPLNGRY